MTLPSSVTPQLLERLMSRVSSSGECHWDLREVYTGNTVVALPQSSPDDINDAFEKARRAQRIWSSWSVSRRVKVMKRFHALLVKNIDTIADLLQVESGKARRMAFEECADPAFVATHYMKRAPKLLQPLKRSGPVPVVSTSTEVRSPKGVVGLISPWNFPFAITMSDSIPALLAGNGIVLKPDNKTALSPLFGVDLMYQAGIPEGLFGVVCGEGPDIGPTMIPNSDYVMFTGSSDTGRVIGSLAADNLIGSCLELGGKNPMIVLPDANLTDAVNGALFGVFGNTGQICMHIERIYVHESIYDEFREKFVQGTENLKIGADYTFTPHIGSLISTDHLQRVQEHVDDAARKGATVLTGGNARPDIGPAFFEPTVLENVTSEMISGTCETFGPVVALYKYASIDDAVERANDTVFGLNASVWGTDLSAATDVAMRLEAGNVNVNDALAAAYASKGTPSSGWKQSGLGARHGDIGLLKYTNTKNLAVLKKQVLSSPPDTDYDKQASIMKKTLTVMRLTTKG